jgi:hypothetical protein
VDPIAYKLLSSPFLGAAAKAFLSRPHLRTAKILEKLNPC